jgi:hypothetical protein
VDEPTIGGGHGLKGDGLATGDSAFGHARGEPGDLLLSTVAVLLDIDDDGATVVFTPAKDDVDDILEGAEGFPATANDEACVFALDVDDGGVVRPGSGGPDGWGGIDAH